ncbi:ABC transporter ATP-binding protein [Amycolatopsis samaneae]|uniref:ABC transporter ATP-binding protein n=1 Tax=Amycolatopsis samaneae TaxID=664691 RepID=A0ABW5GBE8_9PSEU
MGTSAIEAQGLTKHFRHTVAVDDLTFSVESGRVTGFLGPNGAGKTTTMRLILGLDAPSSGSATVFGDRYVDVAEPLRTVGALLNARAVHPSRTAAAHLLCLAQAAGMSARRVDTVLGMVGLSDVAGKKAGTFSLGMSQRLGIAAALLGDPPVLIFDEPVNGLDPEGIRWIRTLMRALAAEGRTVLVSSHLMSEMALTSDHLLVVGRGRLIADSPMTEFIDRHDRRVVRVRTDHERALIPLLSAEGAHVQSEKDGSLTVTGLESGQIGVLAASCRAALAELTPVRGSLEDVFMDVTRDVVDYGVSS